MRIALLTARTLAKTDFDLPPLIAAFAAAGVRAEALAWDDPASDPATFDFCILRSTWNYFHAPMAFRAWLAQAAARTRLFNPLPVVQWNLDKRYLLDLQRAGLPVIPTEILARDAPRTLAETAGARRWLDVVIKPVVSAGSFRTRRFEPAQSAAGERFLAENLRERDMLIQPYLPSVADGGERAFIWIDGELTHAVQKRPRFAGSPETVVAAPPPSAAERAFVERAIAAWRESLLYARVDTIRDDDGELCLSELELIEPSLFFHLGPGAAARFVTAVLRCAAT